MARVKSKWARIDGRVLSMSGAPVEARLSVAPTSHPSVVTLEDGTVVVAGSAFTRADDAGRVLVDVVVGDSATVEVALSTPGNLIARRTCVLESGKEYDIHDLIRGTQGNPPPSGGLSIRDCKDRRAHV